MSFSLQRFSAPINRRWKGLIYETEASVHPHDISSEVDSGERWFGRLKVFHFHDFERKHLKILSFSSPQRKLFCSLTRLSCWETCRNNTRHFIATLALITLINYQQTNTSATLASIWFHPPDSMMDGTLAAAGSPLFNWSVWMFYEIKIIFINPQNCWFLLKRRRTFWFILIYSCWQMAYAKVTCVQAAAAQGQTDFCFVFFKWWGVKYHPWRRSLWVVLTGHDSDMRRSERAVWSI